MVTNELRLEQGDEPSCYCIWQGFSLRAIIMPTKPTKWNGKARWRVDAIGLHVGDVPTARTLSQAKAIAYHYASY